MVRKTVDPDVIDFDAGWQEEEHEPVKIVVLGVKYELPADVPAKVLLMMDRLLLLAAKVQQSGEVPDDFVIEDAMSPESILRQLVDDSIVDEWLDKGIGYRRLMAIVRKLNAVYRGEEDEQAPNRAARRQAAKATKATSGGSTTRRPRSSASGRR